MRSPSSSRPSTTLTGEDRERYWRDGYVLLRGLIDKETLERIDARFLALVTGEATASEGMVLMKDVHFVWNREAASLTLTALQRRRLVNDSHALVQDGMDRHGLWRDVCRSAS